MAAVIIVCTLFFGVFTFYYVKYQKVIDKRMHGVIFANTGKIYAGCYKVRPESKRSLKMCYGSSKFPLLREDPAQSALRLGMCGQSANRFFEIGTGRSQVALAESLLTPLIGKARCGRRGGLCLSKCYRA